MRVYISVDMEGIAGVVSESQVVPGSAAYGVACQLMTDEANAAVRGVRSAGAESVVVNDAHGQMLNIHPGELEEAAELISGSPKVPLGMMQGISDDFDCCIFVGYHGAAGAQRSVLAHTMDPEAFADVQVNDISWSETTLNASIADAFAVPLVLLSGDQIICQQIIDDRPDVRTFTTKESLGYSTARNVHPRLACAAIEELAREAVSGGSAGVSTRERRSIALSPCKLRIRFARVKFADACAAIPGSRREDAWEVTFDCADTLVVRQYLQVCSLISHGLLVQNV